MCTDKNNDNNDKNNNELNPFSFLLQLQFLNCWKTAKLMNFKFSDFQFAFVNCLAKN